MGNAFRMAYAAQLQRQPTFQDVIASQLQDKTTSVENNNSRINWVRHFLLVQKWHAFYELKHHTSDVDRKLILNSILYNKFVNDYELKFFSSIPSCRPEM